MFPPIGSFPNALPAFRNRPGDSRRLSTQAMRMNFRLVFLLLLGLLSSCEVDRGDSFSSSESSTPSGGEAGGQQNQPGVITAGEWNDLEQWAFWEELLKREEYQALPAYWSIYNKHRIAVKLVAADQSPVVNAPVTLKRNDSILFRARSDNQGRAELWVDIFEDPSQLDLAQLSLEVNQGAQRLNTPKAYPEGINEITVPAQSVEPRIEVSFVVDATGSMGDELEYLKTELLDVISRIEAANPTASLYSSAVFYRDQNDEYLTRVSAFSGDPKTTINFIKQQSASGGGDYPEAVHSALNQALQQLQWSTDARARILFLILDAPPHYDNLVLRDLQNAILQAAAKGIKIIPVSASGIDKQTEFLMRFFAISTNGTYVFITDDSGIGNSHLAPTVGNYQVEYLNDLMVRLINEAAQ